MRTTDNNELEVLLNGRNITNELDSNSNTVVDIQRTETNTIETSFSNGISVAVTLLSGILNVVTTLPQDIMTKTQGLLGNFNGNDTDDFIYPNGTILHNGARDRQIHYFGQSCS